MHHASEAARQRHHDTAHASVYPTEPRLAYQPGARARHQHPHGGALPIKIGDDVIGAAGVSGAPGGEKDEACVKAGLDKVADQLK